MAASTTHESLETVLEHGGDIISFDVGGTESLGPTDKNCIVIIRSHSIVKKLGTHHRGQFGLDCFKDELHNIITTTRHLRARVGELNGFRRSTFFVYEDVTVNLQ